MNIHDSSIAPSSLSIFSWYRDVVCWIILDDHNVDKIIFSYIKPSDKAVKERNKKTLRAHHDLWEARW